MPSRKAADPQHDESGGPLQGMPQHGFPKSGKRKAPVGWMVATLLISTVVAVVVVVRVVLLPAARCPLSLGRPCLQSTQQYKRVFHHLGN
jgi:hypothetical protein